MTRPGNSTETPSCPTKLCARRTSTLRTVQAINTSKKVHILRPDDNTLVRPLAPAQKEKAALGIHTGGFPPSKYKYYMDDGLLGLCPGPTLAYIFLPQEENKRPTPFALPPSKQTKNAARRVFFIKKKYYLDNSLYGLPRFKPGLGSVLLRKKRRHPLQAQGDNVPVILGGNHGAINPAALGELRQRQALVHDGGAKRQLDVAPLRLFGKAGDGASDHLETQSC